MATFDPFEPDNDPYDERVMFKIDYYERSGRFASHDPADTSVNACVLTVMLAVDH